MDFCLRCKIFEKSRLLEWEFLMVEQTFLSPQVKWSVINSNKNDMYELPHDLQTTKDLGS